MTAVLSIQNLCKTYKGGLVALDEVSLDIREGEIFALLGPNGAGKTTLISAICGIVAPSSGRVLVAGYDTLKDYRVTRSLIGLVPQEVHVEAFETVEAVVNFSRRLFGLPPNPARIEEILRDLSLWDKRHSKLIALSGGMKRRVLIAKALAHDPRVLFLDEPTAGVDVELRRDLWNLVRRMRDQGVTIILTTHYIEEAEEMADRVGVILGGKLLLVEEKNTLMKKLGKKRLTLQLSEPLPSLPPELGEWKLELSAGGSELHYEFDVHADQDQVPSLLRSLDHLGLNFKDLSTHTSSLEEIFVNLVGDSGGSASQASQKRPGR